MAVAFTSLAELAAHGFDSVIDVRSPSEYAEDHVPGAISLPVLDDEERARVGTIYVRDSAFRARKIGAALVARNAARHIESALAEKDGGWRPLVYCWRGGQRSGAFAAILKQIGWRADTIEGGYRSYRRMVVSALYDTPWPTELRVLDGYTGTAKTALLGRLAARGVQVVDLEGMARHRGSVLGGRPEGQPSQKAFESAIAGALVACDPARPVIVEAESSKVGDLIVPPALWTAMRAAPRLRIEAPVAARAAYLVRAYTDMTAAPQTALASLAKLAPYHGHKQIERWGAMLAEGDHASLAEELITRHYDPRYEKSRQSNAHGDVTVVPTDALTDADLDDLAGRLAGLIS